DRGHRSHHADRRRPACPLPSARRPAVRFGCQSQGLLDTSCLMGILTPLALDGRARGVRMPLSFHSHSTSSLSSRPPPSTDTRSHHKASSRKHPNKARRGWDVMHGPRVWAKGGQARETQTWKMTDKTKTMRPASYEEGIGVQKKRTNQRFSCS